MMASSLSLRIRHRLVGVGVIGLLAILSRPACALTLVTEDYPPFNMVEANQVGGVSTLMLREALKRTNLTAKFDLFPWARALALAEMRPDTCVYSTVRSPDREKKFKWAGPLVDDKIGLFARTENTIKLAQVSDAKGRLVGGYVADAYADFVERQGVIVDRAPSDVQNLAKLMARHIDLWIAGAISGPYRAKREGYANQIRMVVTGGNPSDTQMWLACNPAVADDTMKRLDTAIKAIISDGTAAGFLARYR